MRKRGGGIRIGNIDEISEPAPSPIVRLAPGQGTRVGVGKRLGVGRGLGLGQRVRELSTTALDRGQAQAKTAIEDYIPGPDSLAPELNPAEQEQVIQGLEMVLGALQHARGREAHNARALAQGLYESVAGLGDNLGMGHTSSRGLAGPYDDSVDVESEGIVDIIGLDGAGGFVRPDNNEEWR